MTDNPKSQDKILEEIKIIEQIMEEFGIEYKDAQERYNKMPGFYKTRYGPNKDKFKLKPNEVKGLHEIKR